MSLASISRSDKKAQKLRKRVFQVARDYSLDIEGELDQIGVNYLGTYVNARTKKEGGRVKIDFDSHNFFQLSKERQRRTILHELIHVKQFNNSLDDWAKQEFDVSEDFAEKLDGTIWEDVKSVEGETELILSSFFPDEDSSYPYAQGFKRREFESDGIDIDSEITQQIEEETEEILNKYREIENIEVEENIYIEEGSIGETNYKIAIVGGNALQYGPKQVENYLEEEIEEPDYSHVSNTDNYVSGSA